MGNARLSTRRRRSAMPASIRRKSAGITLISMLILAGCDTANTLHRRTELHMGTPVTISIGGGSRRVAEAAMADAFKEIARLDQLLSHYKQGSEVYRLNQHKRIERPSEELFENITNALSFSRLVEGAFDITVLPILDLYEDALLERKQIPTAEEIGAVLETVDYRSIDATRTSISIGDNQKITLGGIAKGYAVDRGMQTLLEAGLRSAIVEAGGDMRIAGKKTMERDWHIAIQNPRDREDYIARIRAPDMAVVTSGDYERYYDPERLYHHIIDPLTGRSATELVSVTVVAKTAFDADAISTAAFVLGRERGLALVESLGDVEALLITRTQMVIKSSGWGSFEVE
jgi:FAD:protein FMN transferase